MPSKGGGVGSVAPHVGGMRAVATAPSESRTCSRVVPNRRRRSAERTRTRASRGPVARDEGRGERDPRRIQEDAASAVEGVVDGEEADARVEGTDGRALLRLGSWVGAACAFGAGVTATLGARAGQAYFAGYVLEQSLSIDNLFVFVLIFQYFRVPSAQRKKILDYGIYSAAVLRLGVIALGTELLQRFEPLLLVFAVVLLYSSYGILVAKEGDAQDEDLSSNAVVQGCRKLFRVTDQYDGGRFFTVGGDGVRRATPMLVALITVEVSDVVFAVDSIPAVFGVTRDPFLVYTSNLFAIASLRALYAFVATAVEELRYLQASVGWVLAFVGAKIVVEYAGVDVPTELSLAVVLLVLAGGVVASLLATDAPSPSAASEEGSSAETKPTSRRKRPSGADGSDDRR
mmetsp:Transcript_5904/g.20794  ORF Transcript_5904/g.20794 Transcript_5904/m.20794 type:complete len:402 (+) Transcript_5904:1413-2618(+)